MKVAVPVIKRQYGSVLLDVDLPANISEKGRKLHVQKAAKEAVKKDKSIIKWGEPDEPCVEFGYMTIDD